MHDIWNPWHGCVKKSEGCDNCYMYFLDRQRNADGRRIYKVKNNFDYPLQKDSLNQALDVIKVTRPRQAYLTHMSHQMGLHEQAQKLLPSGCAFAYDGLTVGIAEQ